jgi:hypothetical protein
MKDSRIFKDAGLIQVVGHTGQPEIDPDSTSYWFIDTLGSSGEYLMVENGEIEVKKL